MKKILVYLFVFLCLIWVLYTLPITLYLFGIDYEWYIPMFVLSDATTTTNVDKWENYTFKEISIKRPPSEIIVKGTKLWKLSASDGWIDVMNRPEVVFTLGDGSIVWDPQIRIEIISFFKPWFPNNHDYQDYNLAWNGVRCKDDIFWRNRNISGYVFKYQICTEGLFQSEPNTYYHDRYIYETDTHYYLIDINKWPQMKLSSEVQVIINSFLENINITPIQETSSFVEGSQYENSGLSWKEVNNSNFWSKIPGYSPLWITFSYPENWKFNCCGDRDDGSVHQIIASGSYIGNPPHILIMKYIINCRREDIGYSDTWLCKKPLTDSQSFDYLTTLSWWVLLADTGSWFVEVSRDWIMTRDFFTSNKDQGFVFRKNWGIYIVQFHNSPSFEQKFIEDFLSRIKDDVAQ